MQDTTRPSHPLDAAAWVPCRAWNWTRLLATIEDRAVVERILTHLGLPVDLPQPSAARTPEWLPGVRRAADHEHADGHWAD